MAQNLVDNFNASPSMFLFLISTRAGGMGLNLTGANKCARACPPALPPACSVEPARAQERSHWHWGCVHAWQCRLAEDSFLPPCQPGDTPLLHLSWRPFRCSCPLSKVTPYMPAAGWSLWTPASTPRMTCRRRTAPSASARSGTPALWAAIKRSSMMIGTYNRKGKTFLAVTIAVHARVPALGVASSIT
jgi:hypothetical protein